MLQQALTAAAASALLLVGGTAAAQRVPGVRFAVDTAELPAPARGAFATFVGVVEFAAGRGRLDVAAVRAGPALAVSGVTIARPLARQGDYYLFDSTGYVLVRPAARTFTRFALDRAAVRQGDVREDGEGFFEFGPLRADTLAAGDSARLAQHGPFAIRWHLDRRHATGPATVLARGRLEVRDAPAGEAGVVRWFGAAAALAGMTGGMAGGVAGTLPSDSLQLTAVPVLTPPGQGRAPVHLILLHPLARVAVAAIDLTRLAVPAGFRELPWPSPTHPPRPRPEATRRAHPSAPQP